MTAIRIGISTKLYLGYRQTLEWIAAVCEIARENEAVANGRVRLFIAPTAAALESAIALTKGTGIIVAAQDVSEHLSGAFTGDIGAPFLAELGVGIVEIGHAERRRLHSETDEIVGRKAAAAHASGLIPLLCVGEREHLDAKSAARICVTQAAAAAAGPIILAYEPVWAIGAIGPAPVDHIRAVVTAIKRMLPSHLAESEVIYGGSAGPGLLASLRPEVDGLFLGRFAHDPENVRRVLAEAELVAHC